MPAAANETREERIEAQLKALPAKPGVYLFRGPKDAVLYVGKAKSLRSRVRSYFRAGDARLGLDQMVERVERIEVIVTSTEPEALHLEQNLIRRHRPPFNVRLRDDKSYPYIAVTVEDEYPRVMFTRERHRRGVVYFGPYANAKKVRETLDVLNRAFPYRPCEGPQPGRHSGIPCLDYHIERCLAPCVGYVSREDYRAIVDGVIEFLSGETRPILRQLEAKMKAAAEAQRFEEAARNRNRLNSVRHLAERQAADKRAIGTIDVLGIATADDRAAVQVFPLRGGRLVDRHSFHLENTAGQDLATLIEAFCLEYYGSAPAVPPEIVIPAAAGENKALEQFLTELRGSRVEVRPARRGEKRRLQELATQNAELALEQDAAEGERRRLRRVEALEELREALNLESLPLRIECFDISNIQDTAPVGSMVVFQDAQPKKAHYRKFGIRRTGGPGRLRDDGGGRGAALRPRPGDRGGRLRRVVRRRAEPRRHRRRQGPALGRAGRDEGVRPAARGGHRAREAGGGGVPARAVRARCGSIRARRGSSCSSGSATRRTGSRSASTGNGAPRRRTSRSSTRCRASARPASGRCSSTSARPSGCSRRRRRSSRACPASPRRPAAPCTRRCTGRAEARASRRARRPGTARARPSGTRAGRCPASPP